MVGDVQCLVKTPLNNLQTYGTFPTLNIKGNTTAALAYQKRNIGHNQKHRTCYNESHRVG
jgi:hypothetical protein